MARSLGVASPQTGPKDGVHFVLDQAFAFGIVAVGRGAEWLMRPE